MCHSLSASGLHGKGPLCRSGMRSHVPLEGTSQISFIKAPGKILSVTGSLKPALSLCWGTRCPYLHPAVNSHWLRAHGNLPCFAAAKDRNLLVRSISRALYNKRRPETSAARNAFLVKMPSASGFPVRPRRGLTLNRPGAVLPRGTSPCCCVSCSSFSFVCFNSITLI